MEGNKQIQFYLNGYDELQLKRDHYTTSEEHRKKEKLLYYKSFSYYEKIKYFVDTDFWVHNEFDPEIIELMINDDDVRVRYFVARFIKTDVNILKRLENDKEEMVVAGLYQNPHYICCSIYEEGWAEIFNSASRLQRLALMKRPDISYALTNGFLLKIFSPENTEFSLLEEEKIELINAFFKNRYIQNFNRDLCHDVIKMFEHPMFKDASKFSHFLLSIYRFLPLTKGQKMDIYKNINPMWRKEILYEENDEDILKLGLMHEDEYVRLDVARECVFNKSELNELINKGDVGVLVGLFKNKNTPENLKELIERKLSKLKVSPYNYC